MNALEVMSEEESPYRAQGALLRTLVLCDLVDSTALVERLGDVVAAELIRKHDRLARAIMQRHGGHEIDKTDGFLLLFERPAQAVAYALEYQRALQKLGDEQAPALQARVGIHVGDVVVWENTPEDIAQGAKPVEVEGLVKPVAARLMSLARPGQILVSAVAQSLAQRGEREYAELAPRVRWLPHGRYVFKGLPEPLAVVEVGEIGVAPFRTPPANPKAARVMPWWMRPVSVAVGVLTLGLAIGVPVYLSTHSDPALAFAERDWVVVGDLRNLTSEKVFDGALDTAFRISLEQSRYVNVLSQLQVRDALTRMQRPDDAPIDRSIGAEIAMREGARALIIPTIAEVGGQLRISAEVIEPRTQATVHVEAVDGEGAEEVLQSVDRVARRLRGRLGEALAAVQTDQVPLDRVTTANLDALRAYSLGVRAQLRGRFAEALSLYRQAEAFDPRFALAILGQARVYLSSDDRGTAWTLLQRAQALREHVPTRERLYLDALVATYGPPAPMLEKWRVLGSMYPDHYAAFANYGLFAYQYTSQYAEAAEVAAGAIAERNSGRGATHYLRGALYLALDRYEQALNELGRARAMGGHGMGLIEVEAMAALRRYDEADALMAKSPASGMADNDLSREITLVVLALDRGDFGEAATRVRRAQARAQAMGPVPSWSVRTLALAVTPYTARGDDAPPPLAEQVRELLAALPTADPSHRYELLFCARLAAVMAARHGDVATARLAAAASIDGFDADEYPKLLALGELARAAIAVDESDGAAALRLLATRSERADLYLDRIVRIEALAAGGRIEQALAEADAAAAHRGLAWAELGPHNAQRAFNVAESDLAVLRGAELAAQLGRHDDAAKRLRKFRELWPAAGDVPALARRMAALERSP